MLKVFIFVFFALFASGAPVLNPNFNGNPMWVPAGTPIVPLCTHPQDPSCLSQWSHQALPLAVYPGGMGNNPQMQYFFPAFIPDSGDQGEIDESSDWKPWRPSRSSRFSRRDRSSSSRQRRSQDSKKETPVTLKSPEGEIDLEGEIKPEGEIEPEIETAPQKQKPERNRGRLDIGQTGEEEADSPPLAHPPRPDQARTRTFYTNQRNQAKVVETDPEGNQTSQLGSFVMISLEDINSSGDGKHETARGTQVIPATTEERDEGETGCISLGKTEETEADFCADCKRESEVLSSLFSERGFFSSLLGHLKEVSWSAKDKISKRIAPPDRGVTQICSPEKPLRAIINNFNRDCPGDGDNKFEGFFKKAYCESCKKGVPLEIMMAMMSVESSGLCKAQRVDSREQSGGLFQVNSNVHQCVTTKGGRTRIYRIGTPDNLQCLKDPINNLNASVKILSQSYQQTNGRNLTPGKCPSWKKLTEEEKDGWRRGVSGYNGGPDWVLRAIESASDERTLTDTSYLITKLMKETEKRKRQQYRKSNMSWERLREYYFLEMLSPGNRGKKSGRQLELTVSNLAHTEAVLGRNVKGSELSMVALWEQYTNKFLKEPPKTCPSFRR